MALSGPQKHQPWVSDTAEAPWGWVVFHYGRWVWIDDIGWAWVPGREWGPAWVDWRRGGGYVGWVPLPPDELVVEIRDEPQYWIFCRPKRLPRQQHRNGLYRTGARHPTRDRGRE